AGMTADRALRDWTAADLRTIGYFAKVPGRRPDWLRAPQVEWVCSVSDCSCASKSPERWIDHWLHNQLWLFDTLALLERVLPVGQGEGFVRYGLKTLPVSFSRDERTGARSENAWDLSAAQPEPIPQRYFRLGYDLCECTCGNALECSPLSCNSKAAEIATNRWCLLDDFEVALRLAREWGSDGIGVEPGPYVLVEVWADRRPDQPST